MAEILVLVDHVDGAPKKVTYEPLTTLTLGDAGIEGGQVGLASAPSQVVDFANKPPRSSGQIVKDEGDGGQKVAEFLASQKFV